MEEISELCLVCLESNNDLINIFSDFGEENYMSKILSDHFWFQNFDDGHHICRDCWKVIEDFHSFFLKIARAHAKFYELNSIAELDNDIQEYDKHPNIPEADENVGVINDFISANTSTTYKDESTSETNGTLEIGIPNNKKYDNSEDKESCFNIEKLSDDKNLKTQRSNEDHADKNEDEKETILNFEQKLKNSCNDKSENLSDFFGFGVINLDQNINQIEEHVQCGDYKANIDNEIYDINFSNIMPDTIMNEVILVSQTDITPDEKVEKRRKTRQNFEINEQFSDNVEEESQLHDKDHKMTKNSSNIDISNECKKQNECNFKDPTTLEIHLNEGKRSSRIRKLNELTENNQISKPEKIIKTNNFAEVVDTIDDEFLNISDSEKPLEGLIKKSRTKRKAEIEKNHDHIDTVSETSTKIAILENTNDMDLYKLESDNSCKDLAEKFQKKLSTIKKNCKSKFSLNNIKLKNESEEQTSTDLDKSKSEENSMEVVKQARRRLRKHDSNDQDQLSSQLDKSSNYPPNVIFNSGSEEKTSTDLNTSTSEENSIEVVKKGRRRLRKHDLNDQDQLSNQLDKSSEYPPNVIIYNTGKEKQISTDLNTSKLEENSIEIVKKGRRRLRKHDLNDQDQLSGQLDKSSEIFNSGPEEQTSTDLNTSKSEENSIEVVKQARRRLRKHDLNDQDQLSSQLDKSLEYPPNVIIFNSEPQNNTNLEEEINISNNETLITKTKSKPRGKSIGKIKISNKLQTASEGDEKNNDTNTKVVQPDVQPKIKRVRRRKIDPNGIAEEDKNIRTFVSMKCDVCNFGDFKDLIECRSHYREHHNMEGYLKCCDIRFTRRLDLVSHIERHMYPDGVICRLCNRKFTNKLGLHRHKLKMHNYTNQYKCNKCSKSFNQPYLLRIHNQRHKANEEGYKNACPKCKKLFSTSNSLTNHIRLMHEKSLAHVCDICARVFTSKYGCNLHKRNKHSGEKLPPAQCIDCNMWLKNENCLEKHRAAQHGENKDEFVCNICGKQMANRRALYDHKKIVHLTEKTFKCTFCEKSFKSERTLKEHLSRHTGDKLYSCKYCSKTCNSISTMHAHRKKVHPEEWKAERLKTFST